MKARGLILFVLLNVIISIAVAFLVIQFVDTGNEENPEFQRFATVVVQITTTPLPPEIIIVTATPREGEIAAIPTGVLDEVTPTNTPTPEVQGNVSEEDIAANPELEGTVSALPQGCIVHTLEEGESPALLAEIYGVTVENILAVNGLTEDDAFFLQIGQVLTIPLEGCALLPEEETDTTTETDDETTDADTGTTSEEAEATDVPLTPTVTPTITLAPTASAGNAQVEIVEVSGVGDVTSESIVVFNSGRNVNLDGWTLSDLDGNEFTFSDQNLFTEGSITVYSRFGEDTTVNKFWNLTEPLLSAGDVLTLLDNEGNVRSIVRIPE